MADEQTLLADIQAATEAGERETTVALTQRALDQGIEVTRILDDALIAAMDVIGGRFSRGEIYVPEMLISAHAMKGAMELLRPILTETGVKARGRCLIGTVEGDMHDIGQNLVHMMWEGAGFEVINLGTETTAQEFIDAIKQYEPDVVGMSALLTTTMVHMPENIAAFKEAGVRDRVRVIVGGAPVTQEYADEMGADAYGKDAATAVEIVKAMVPDAG